MSCRIQVYFLFREMYVGNTSELAWPGATSSALKCIGITNFFEKSHKIQVGTTLLKSQLQQ